MTITRTRTDSCQRLIQTEAKTPHGRTVAIYSRPCSREVFMTADLPGNPINALMDEAPILDIDLCSEHYAETIELIEPYQGEPEFIRIDAEVH